MSAQLVQFPLWAMKARMLRQLYLKEQRRITSRGQVTSARVEELGQAYYLAVLQENGATFVEECIR